MLEQQDKYRDYLRHRAVQNIRANVRRLRIVITLPIDIALFVLVEWAIATFHISPFWRPDGNGQSDLGVFVALAWFLLLTAHTILSIINIGWEIIVRREMGKIRRTEAQSPAIGVDTTEKAKRPTHLTSDGELIEEDNYADDFSEDSSMAQEIKRKHRSSMY